MLPIRKLQDEKLAEHKKAMDDYEIEKLHWQAELADWKRKKNRPAKPPEKPVRPAAVRLIISDTTVEAVAPILLENPRGVMLERDELAGWVGSFDRYAQTRGADAAHWLSMYDGDSILVDRKTGEPPTIRVPSAAVSVGGGIQPQILERMIGSKHREDGLLARILMAWPPPRRKRWTDAELPASTQAAFGEILNALYDLKSNVVKGERDEDDELRPVVVLLSPEGKSAWNRFYNENADELADLTGDLAAAWSKLEAVAARLALVVHFIRWAAQDPTLSDPNAVDEKSMAVGVTLTRWFGQQVRRVYAIFGESDENRGRRRLVEWIERHGGKVTVRELTHGMSQFRGKTATADAQAALEDLLKAGYGTWKNPAPGEKGGRPTKRFELHAPRAITKTPAAGSAVEGFGCGDAGDTDEWGEL